MKNRPAWCPYPTCIFLMNTQDKICTGRLPEPVPHDGDENTHRFCLDERETGHGVHDLMINRTDAWHMTRHMQKVREETERKQ